VKRAEEFFNRYGTWAVGIAAFTLIPYKVFTIASGVFMLRNLKVFIAASFLGRGWEIHDRGSAHNALRRGDIVVSQRAL